MEPTKVRYRSPLRGPRFQQWLNPLLEADYVPAQKNMAAERRRRMENAVGSNKARLEKERSACPVCLGSRYCCRHVDLARINGRAVREFKCTCKPRRCTWPGCSN